VLLAPLQDRLLPLPYVDSGPPGRPDHLPVARVATLVGSEVEDTHADLVRGRVAVLRLEHLLDVEVVRTAGALLVVARDQLAQKPEGEELQPEDDEQDAEGEQRALPDRLAGELEHREVDQQDGSDCAECQSEAPEEVERTVPVPAHEPDRHEVEKAADVPLDAVVGSSVLPRSMVDGQLGDAITAVVSEHRQEAMELSVDPQVSHDLGPVGLQSAVHVVQSEAGPASGAAVEDPREQPAREWISPLGLPARDEVEALIELGQEAWDLGGVVLEVGVDRDGDIAGRMPEASCERRRFAEVAAQANHHDIRRRRGEPGQSRKGPVGRAVVDEDGLPRTAERLEGAAKLLVERLDAPFLVVDRNDDGDHGSSLCM